MLLVGEESPAECGTRRGGASHCGQGKVRMENSLGQAYGMGWGWGYFPRENWPAAGLQKAELIPNNLLWGSGTIGGGMARGPTP